MVAVGMGGSGTVEVRGKVEVEIGDLGAGSSGAGDSEAMGGPGRSGAEAAVVGTGASWLVEVKAAVEVEDSEAMVGLEASGAGMARAAVVGHPAAGLVRHGEVVGTLDDDLVGRVVMVEGVGTGLVEAVGLGGVADFKVVDLTGAVDTCLWDLEAGEACALPLIGGDIGGRVKGPPTAVVGLDFLGAVLVGVVVMAAVVRAMGGVAHLGLAPETLSIPRDLTWV